LNFSYFVVCIFLLLCPRLCFRLLSFSRVSALTAHPATDKSTNDQQIEGFHEKGAMSTH
jgi:hypothetical protein